MELLTCSLLSESNGSDYFQVLMLLIKKKHITNVTESNKANNRPAVKLLPNYI